MDARTCTILVVEDAKEALHAYAVLLQSSGFNVLTAPNGQEAVRLSPLHHIDVLLTDLNLPDIPGDILIERLRAQASTPLRIAAITGEATERQAQARHAGADVIFTKPVEWSTILRWLEGPSEPRVPPGLDRSTLL